VRARVLLRKICCHVGGALCREAAEREGLAQAAKAAHLLGWNRLPESPLLSFPSRRRQSHPLSRFTWASDTMTTSASHLMIRPRQSIRGGKDLLCLARPNGRLAGLADGCHESELSPDFWASRPVWRRK
jgi:hypothetical protein